VQPHCDETQRLTTQLPPADMKVSCDCRQHVCVEKRASVASNRLDLTMPTAPRESTTALPDVATATARTALRQSPVLRRSRSASQVKSSYVSRQAVASSDCVTVLGFSYIVRHTISIFHCALCEQASRTWSVGPGRKGTRWAAACLLLAKPRCHLSSRNSCLHENKQIINS